MRERAGGRPDASIVRSWPTRCVAGNPGSVEARRKGLPFLDDIYVWSPSPNRMATVHTTMQEQLLAHTGIQIHHGKTVVEQGRRCPFRKYRVDSCSSGVGPRFYRVRGEDSELNTEDQGLVILGTPLGHEDFARSNLAKKSGKHDQLILKILHVPDLQCAWITPPFLRLNASQLHLAGGAPPLERHIREAPRCIIAPSFGPFLVSPPQPYFLGCGKFAVRPRRSWS